MSVLAVAMLALVSMSSGDSLEFVEGDPSKLGCRVDARASTPTMVVVEVSNPSKYWVEPLVFEWSTNKSRGQYRPDLLEIRRSPAPSFGRSGRAVPPKGKTKYYLPRGLGDKEDVRERLRVLSANFFRKPVIDECPIELVSEADGSTKLINHSKFPAFAIMLVRNAGPEKDWWRVCGEALEPEETWTVDANSRGRPLSCPSSIGGAPDGDCEFKLVDWSVLVDGHEDRASLYLQQAWDAEARWPDPRPVLHADVAYRLEGERWTLESSDRTGTVAIKIRSDGTVQIPDRSRKVDQARGYLPGYVAAAFSELRRPAFADIDLEGITLESIFGDPAIHVPMSKRIQGLESGANYLRAGHIDNGLGYNGLFRWERDVERDPSGKVRTTEVRQYAISWGKKDLRTKTRYSYDDRGDLPVVSEYIQEYYNLGQVYGRLDLRFRNFQFDQPDSEEGTEPIGTGVALLHDAWERGYRYPADCSLTASIHVSTPQRPLDWVGRRDTRLDAHFTNWSGGTRPYEKVSITTKGVKADQVPYVKSIFGCRMSIWSRQDLAGRGAFAEEFAGASIELSEERPGVFEIDHPRYHEVEVQDGDITGITWVNGIRRNYEWQEIDGQRVVVEVTQTMSAHESTVTLDWATMENGVLFPQRVEIRDWFDREWGPEIFQFQRVTDLQK